MSESFLTTEGAARLRAELQELIEVKRPEIARRLREAIKMGDLSENADYIMAKEDQAFLEGRIQELTQLLSRATIIGDGAAPAGAVSIGSRVTVQESGQDPETFVLVGAKEADPRAGRISNESPLGRALLGKRVGETAEFETPGGIVRFRILKIE
ncbi:MAG: transcription elongation factor GreA [Anaerolineales bacterium]|nr:transcription elongation factor GreA [Anaerolineales bacterium]